MKLNHAGHCMRCGSYIQGFFDKTEQHSMSLSQVAAIFESILPTCQCLHLNLPDPKTQDDYSTRIIHGQSDSSIVVPGTSHAETAGGHLW